LPAIRDRKQTSAANGHFSAEALNEKKFYGGDQHCRLSNDPEGNFGSLDVLEIERAS
jgi:hypothetical protein